MKFIGLDAHSKTCFFVVLGKTGRTLKRQRVTTNESNLLEFVRAVKGPKKLVFEEGVMSQWLFVLYKDEVDELAVCQPTEHDGPKNDEQDAWNLADLLRVGRLKSVFHADNELMNLRTLVSGHDDLVGEITREKNRLKALFRQVAIPTERKFYQSPELVWQLPTDTQQYVACTLYERLDIYEEQRLGYHERFESNAKRFKDTVRQEAGQGPADAEGGVQVHGNQRDEIEYIVQAQVRGQTEERSRRKDRATRGVQGDSGHGAGGLEERQEV